MKAVIFAAGIGSRLKPFTDFHPKALVPVAGKPALQRVIEHVAASGADTIVVNVHHFAQQIIDFLRTYRFPGVEIIVSDESELLLDTAGALAKIVREIPAISNLEPNESILVHNADIITDIDIGDMVRQHIATEADATLLVDSSRQSSRHFLFKDWVLKGWINNKTGQLRPEGTDPSPLKTAAFGGVHIVRRRLLDEISKSCGKVLSPRSITDFYIDTCQSHKFCAYMPTGKYLWHDIGTPEKLMKAENDIIN